MGVLCVVILASLLSAQALIMPIAKPDGSLDIPSLLSHISLLEQSLGNKASLSVISTMEQTMTKLESDMQRAWMEQHVTQSKLDTALDELKDLSNVKTELAVLQSQMQSDNGHCSCGSPGNSDNQTTQEVSGLRADVSTLKSEVNQLQSLTNQTDVSLLSADVSTIKAEILQLQSLRNRTDTIGHPTQGSSVFTRWGRTSCPPGNNMVYKGYAAGSYYAYQGQSPSMLCLPEDPIYSNHTYGVHGDEASLLYGTEYKADYTDMPFRSLTQEDMPCAVCESKRATSIMVPARNACYQGWTLEYSGYLMGGLVNQSPAEYICVDTDAEAIPGGHDIKYGRLLYPVETKCGALVCPPYVDGKSVTCVLCTK